MNTDKTNVEYKMHDNIGNDCNHRNGNYRSKEKSGSYTRKTFNRFTAAKIAVLRTSYSYIIRKVLQSET